MQSKGCDSSKKNIKCTSEKRFYFELASKIFFVGSRIHCKDNKVI